MLGSLVALMLAQNPVAITRPRDPWVFRSVLDQRARIVTVELHEKLSVAYDATNCGIYKAWNGTVKFDGAVYNGVHGPQPTSLGAPFLQGIVQVTPWLFGDRILKSVTPRFRGYRISNNTVTLHYSLPAARKGGLEIEIFETPEVKLQDGKIFLTRKLTTKNLPSGKRIGLVTAITGYELTQTNASPISLSSLEKPAWGVDVRGREPMANPQILELKADGATLLTTEMRDIAPKKAVVTGEEASSTSDAFQLSRAETAPKLDGRLDPSWEAVPPIAVNQPIVGCGPVPDAPQARFRYDDENLYAFVFVPDDKIVEDSVNPMDDDAMLIGLSTSDGPEGERAFAIRALSQSGTVPEAKVSSQRVLGGYTIETAIPWGVTGEVPQSGQKVRLNLIVSDDDDGGEAEGRMAALPTTSGTNLLSPAVLSQEQTPREPGLSMRLYFIEVSVDKIPTLVPSQSPNVNQVISKIDFSTKADFGGFEDNFLVHISGFLNVAQAGKYEFRLTSDDGSRMILDGVPLIENDGLHGATSVIGTRDLKVGEHPLYIEYFEGNVDNVLRLEWKKAGDAEFSLIPTSAFSTPKGEVRVTAPGRKNIVSSSGLRPGDGSPLAAVHPAYDLTTIRPDNFRPKVGGMDFLPDGRLVICNWEPEGGVYIVDGLKNDWKTPTVKKIASGLAEPLGLKVVGKDIFVLQKQELTQLVDTNGDDITDEYRSIANGWGVTANFHEFAFGLAYEKGFFYAALATAIDPGGASTKGQNPDRGSVVKIGKNGSYSIVARGLRTPNGIGFGYKGHIYIADNQGDWLPASKVVQFKPGAFYGNRSVKPEEDKDKVETKPVVWLPQGEIGNSPSEPAPMNDGPYKGQMIHGEVTHGGVKRVFVEEVDGQLQGAVFRFTQGLEAGVNRLVWGPDGGLYIGGIGSSGNWGQEGKLRYGLQRIKFNGKSVFEPLAVRAKTNGMELELTEPLKAGMGESVRDYNLSTWKYVPTVEYGGPKVEEKIALPKSISISKDRKRIFFELEGLKDDQMVYIRINPRVRSASGKELWATEAWYTLNRVPKNKVVKVQAKPLPSAFEGKEASEGFVPLFNGKTLEGFRGFKRMTPPKGWSAGEGILAFEPGSERGDLMSIEQYANFDLRFEWSVTKGANSGVFYRVSEQGDVPWATAAEYQVLDNLVHGDGKNPLTSAGSNYAMYPADQLAVKPVGEWNTSRIVAIGSKIQHYLNGKLLFEYDLASADWKQRFQNSKFRDFPNYGSTRSGHFVFQDHGDPVTFRKIRIKTLP